MTEEQKRELLALTGAIDEIYAPTMKIAIDLELLPDGMTVQQVKRNLKSICDKYREIMSRLNYDKLLKMIEKVKSSNEENACHLC